MILGRCPLRIFRSRGTPPRETRWLVPFFFIHDSSLISSRPKERKMMVWKNSLLTRTPPAGDSDSGFSAQPSRHRQVHPKPETLPTPNPKSQIPSPKPQTPNSKPQTSTPDHQLQTPNLKTQNPKPQTPNPNPQTPNPKPQTPNPKSLIPN